MGERVTLGEQDCSWMNKDNICGNVSFEETFGCWKIQHVITIERNLKCHSFHFDPDGFEFGCSRSLVSQTHPREMSASV